MIARLHRPEQLANRSTEDSDCQRHMQKKVVCLPKPELEDFREQFGYLIEKDLLYLTAADKKAKVG